MRKCESTLCSRKSHPSKVIDLSFEDDDADESQTSLTQRHSAPPARPRREQLAQWSISAGSALAAQANALNTKGAKPVGDGSSRALVYGLLHNAPATLPPVGRSYGFPILAQSGATLAHAPADDVRPGDYVVCYGAELSGRKGLTGYSMSVGAPHEPTVGIAIEYEEKNKRKIRCVVQRKGPEEISIRLDDLKSGVVQVGRPIPRSGWIEDWA